MYIGKVRSSESENKLKNGVKIWFEDNAVIDRDVWFVAGNLNGLFRYNLDRKEIFLETFFDKENVDSVRLFSNVCIYNNRLYFIPVKAKQLYEYDIVKREIRAIRHEEFEKGTFFLVHQNEEYIFMADFTKDIWIIYNTLNGKIRIEKRLLETVFGKNINRTKLGYDGENNLCFISYQESNNYIVYNIAENRYEIKRYNHAKKEGYIFFDVNEGVIWGLDSEKNICSLSNDGSIIKKYTVENTKTSLRYIKNEKKGNFVISYSFQDGIISIFDLVKEKYAEWDILESKKNGRSVLGRDFYYMKYINEKICICVNDSKEFIEIDIDEEKKEKFYMEIDINILREYYKKNNAILEGRHESVVFTLSDYINKITMINN